MMTKREFLEEYMELCHKHSCYVGACGCCESPWIVERLDFDDLMGRLEEHEKHLVKYSDFTTKDDVENE